MVSPTYSAIVSRIYLYKILYPINKSIVVLVLVYWANHIHEFKYDVPPLSYSTLFNTCKAKLCWCIVYHLAFFPCLLYSYVHVQVYFPLAGLQTIIMTAVNVRARLPQYYSHLQLAAIYILVKYTLEVYDVYILKGYCRYITRHSQFTL